MTRRPAHIPERKAFPKAIRVAVARRSGGVCEKLSCSGAACELDHGIPVALGGKSTFENCFHLCAECHRKKTALDVKLIAKADRQGGRSGQHARRLKAKAEGRYRPIPSRSLRSSRKLKGGLKWKN